MKFPLCVVRWVDAEALDGDWLTEEEMFVAAKEKMPTCISVGFLIYTGDEHIVLAHTDGVDEFKLSMRIPITWVQEIKEIPVSSELISTEPLPKKSVGQSKTSKVLDLTKKL